MLLRTAVKDLSPLRAASLLQRSRRGRAVQPRLAVRTTPTLVSGHRFGTTAIPAPLSVAFDAHQQQAVVEQALQHASQLSRYLRSLAISRLSVHSFQRAQMWLKQAGVDPTDGQHVIVDSGCGDGDTAEVLARTHPDCFVLGVVDPHGPLQGRARMTYQAGNRGYIRAELPEFWALAAAHRWRVQHYIFHPHIHPQAHPHRVRHRLDTHPSLTALLAMSERLVVHSAWRSYLAHLANVIRAIFARQTACYSGHVRGSVSDIKLFAPERDGAVGEHIASPDSELLILGLPVYRLEVRPRDWQAGCDIAECLQRQLREAHLVVRATEQAVQRQEGVWDEQWKHWNESAMDADSCYDEWTLPFSPTSTPPSQQHANR